MPGRCRRVSPAACCGVDGSAAHPFSVRRACLIPPDRDTQPRREASGDRWRAGVSAAMAARVPLLWKVNAAMRSQSGLGVGNAARVERCDPLRIAAA